VELAGFNDKKLTVMPVSVPEVTYSDVKVDLRWVLSSIYIKLKSRPSVCLSVCLSVYIPIGSFS